MEFSKKHTVNSLKHASLWVLTLPVNTLLKHSALPKFTLPPPSRCRVWVMWSHSRCPLYPVKSVSSTCFSSHPGISAEAPAEQCWWPPGPAEMWLCPPVSTVQIKIWTQPFPECPPISQRSFRKLSSRYWDLQKRSWRGGMETITYQSINRFAANCHGTISCYRFLFQFFWISTCILLV